MGTDQIMYCIVALLLGMFMYHMLKGACGCKTVEGQGFGEVLGQLAEGIFMTGR